MVAQLAEPEGVEQVLCTSSCYYVRLTSADRSCGPAAGSSSRSFDVLLNAQLGACTALKVQ